MYNDEQIAFIKNAKENTDMMWEDIREEFNDTFGETKTANSMRKTYYRYVDIDFNDAAVLGNLKTTHSTRKRSSRLAQENKVLVDGLVTADEIEASLLKISKKFTFKTYKSPKKPAKKGTEKRTIVAHLSDTHIGSIISGGEVGGVNEFNNEIAARRIALFFQQIAEYKPQHRKDTSLVLLINGDLLAGVIHNQEHVVELMTRQYAYAVDILNQGISYLSQNFANVVVRTTTGNHDRVMHKADKGRAMSHKWDSYATMTYFALKQRFAGTNVNVILEEAPYTTFDVLGHRAFATHSDTVFKTGNVSKTVNVGSFSHQIDKINNSDLSKDGKFDMFYLAHIHTIMHTIAPNGEHIFINGSVVGIDSFSNAIGEFSNHPVQQFVEVTKDNIGDVRFVALREADTNKKLDKLISSDVQLFG